MSWTVEKQNHFMELTPRSHRYGDKSLEKLMRDADLSEFPGVPLFVIKDAIEKAYRAGAHDAIFGHGEDVIV